MTTFILTGLYNIVISILAIFSIPYWLIRDGRGRGGWSSRYGFIPEEIRKAVEPAGCLWLHAASVGEVGVLARIVPSLQNLTPELPIIISTVTSTGRNRAMQLFGDQANLVYLPLDAPMIVRRTIRALHPQVLVIAETELWPNLISQAVEYGTGIMLVNGRVSKAAFGRYRIARGVVARMLAGIDKLCVKSDEDLERFIELGAPASSVHVTGDLKSEPLPGVVDATVAERRSRRNLPGDRPIFTAGSTRQGEETLLLDAFENVAGRLPDLLMVIAPRHPQRTAEVEEILRSRGISYLLRTDNQKGHYFSDEQVLLLDTIGELEGFYAASDLAFVGGSLVPLGGHNLLEPALYGVPVLFGPHTGNTGSADMLLLEAGGGKRVEGPVDLADSVVDLIENEQRRIEMGSAARQVVKSSRGALAEVVKYYSKVMGLCKSDVRAARFDRGSRRLRVDEIAEESPDGANL